MSVYIYIIVLKGDKNMANTKEKSPNPRLGKVGGQAVIEGVMMKSGDDMAIASRMADKSIKITKMKFVSVRKKNKLLNTPFLRGVINFVEMMILSYKTLSISADALGIEEEPSKFEKWLEKTLGKSIMSVVMVIATILGIALSAFLFIFLPSFFCNGLNFILDKITSGRFILENNTALFSALEGILKIIIFLVYLFLISFMSDIKRTFQYHGAEHKSVFCYEAGLDLTVENVRKQSRYHPRCGTSFMFLMILIGIIIGLFIPADIGFWRPVIKMLLLPINLGVGFEILMIAGKHDNILIRAISAPGLWVQRLTTKEPDDGQIECAIAALKNALPDEFPEVNEPEEKEDVQTETESDTQEQ